MYTTACESCRKSRLKCIRPSLGRDVAEICERCAVSGRLCETKKRQVGRLPGVKNKIRGLDGSYPSYRPNKHAMDMDDPELLPNPLHFLASTATELPTSHSTQNIVQHDITADPVLQPSVILDTYQEWADKIDPVHGRLSILERVKALVANDQSTLDDNPAEGTVFSGRMDMAKPDASPEHDAISLGLVTLSEAEHLYSSFMSVVTNGAMHFDPQLHTLAFIRAHSSFLLAVILFSASLFVTICADRRLHLYLRAHVSKLEAHVSTHFLKSIEIIQAYLCLATFTEVHTVLCHDQNWSYVSRAIALAIELRLDLPLPHCIHSDPVYSADVHDMMTRNAHRTCFLLYIHDRNMAMTAGRYPIFPESSVFSTLHRWGKHGQATRWDGPLCASISLRKMITGILVKLGNMKSMEVENIMQYMSDAIAQWRSQWEDETQVTREYDMISRFSHFVLALTVLRKMSTHPADGPTRALAERECDELAFEVCCASIRHYKTWPGLLNSATFDTSMVAFCALHVLQAINVTGQSPFSDWLVFQLATVQELVAELEKQAIARHRSDDPGRMNVADAMAKQLTRRIRMLLSRNRQRAHESASISQAIPPGADGLDDLFSSFVDDSGLTQTIPTEVAMPFISDWNFDSLFSNYEEAFGSTSGTGLDPFLGFS